MLYCENAIEHDLMLCILDVHVPAFDGVVP